MESGTVARLFLSIALVSAIIQQGCGGAGTGGSGAAGGPGTGGAKANGGAGGGTGGSAGNSSTGDVGGSVIGGDSVLANHKNLSRDGVYVEAALTKAAAAGLHSLSTFVSASNRRGRVRAAAVRRRGRGRPRSRPRGDRGQQRLRARREHGAQVWMRNLGTPVPLVDMQCGNIDPFGITGTPAIDAVTGALFVDAMTTPDGGTTKKHLIFALSVADGSIKTGLAGRRRRHGHDRRGRLQQSPPGPARGARRPQRHRLCSLRWSLRRLRRLPRVARRPLDHLRRPDVGLGDLGPGGGVWGPAASPRTARALHHDRQHLRRFDELGGGEGLLRFTPGAGFATPAYWAPSNWYPLDQGDEDLGGSGPVLFDLANATPSKLAVALGKDGNAYLLDRNNLPGVGSPVATAHGATNEINNAATVYTTALGTYVAYRAAGAMCTNGSGTLATLKIVPGRRPPSPPHGAPVRTAQARRS